MPLKIPTKAELQAMPVEEIWQPIETVEPQNPQSQNEEPKSPLAQYLTFYRLSKFYQTELDRVKEEAIVEALEIYLENGCPKNKTVYEDDSARISLRSRTKFDPNHPEFTKVNEALEAERDRQAELVSDQTAALDAQITEVKQTIERHQMELDKLQVSKDALLNPVHIREMELALEEVREKAQYTESSLAVSLK